METKIHAIKFDVWFLNLHHFCTAPTEWLPFGICPCQGQIEKLCPTKWGNMYSNGDEAEPSSQRGWALCCGSTVGMWDVNSPARACQYPELFNQTPTARPALSLYTDKHKTISSQTQIKGKIESVTACLWHGGKSQCRVLLNKLDILNPVIGKVCWSWDFLE